jgi:preprotein translocase subunit SecD
MKENIKYRLIVLVTVVLFGVLLLVPTFFKEGVGKSWPLSKPLALGLDLSGGVHLVYEVLTNEAIKSNLQSKATGIKNALIKQKIATLRSRALDNKSLEVVVLNDNVAERAKTFIEQDYKDISFISKEKDGDRVKLIYGISDAQAAKIESLSIDQAVETLRNRVDQFGVSEPLIQKSGENKILLQMPGVSNVEKVKSIVGSVAKLEFRLLPVSQDSPSAQLKEKDGTPVNVEEEILISGDAVDTARVNIYEGKVVVGLTFTPDGSKTFRQITTDNVGRNLAIILDGVVYSSPRINEPIPGGSASIEGQFSVEEATKLAIVLRSGALPAPLKVAEERTVGPTLGQESIRNGILSILFGFVAIMIFMMVYYKKSGFIAVITLLINLFLLVAALSLFGATLTLPGLAGLALTLGIAVDSNVIIFERIRDELRNGMSGSGAIAQGFDKAFSAIFDMNLTGLVTGIILYIFGTGPVRGFAVTLSLGVLTTLFAATFAAKLFFDIIDVKTSKGVSI